MISENASRKKPFQIYGMPWYFFTGFSVIVVTAVYMGKLPTGMIGAYPLMIVLGAALGMIGDNTPFVKTFFGGGTVVVIFGSAALSTNFGGDGNPFFLLPEYAIDIMKDFQIGERFIDFYIASLITGSIMGMNRKLLLKVAVRYLPAILGGTAGALLFVGIVGAASGFGARQAMLFIGLPIMGGGMGAGAVPLSKIFGESMGLDPGEMINMMIPAVALGNALSIVAGGLLNRLGKAKPALTGGAGADARLMRVQGAESEDLGLPPEYLAARDSINIGKVGAGLLVATSFFALGAIINHLIPAIHGYAWVILAVMVVKTLGILPQEFEIYCYQWYQFEVKNLTGVLLVGIGVAFTNLRDIALAFSPEYVLLIFVTVLGAIVGSGLTGRLVGFYPVDSSITAGLCMANMGGTGDVAVLSAAERMELMPFAQISSRIGGAVILVLSSVIMRILYHGGV